MTLANYDLLLVSVCFLLLASAAWRASIQRKSLLACMSLALFAACAAMKIIQFSIPAFIPMPCIDGQCNPTETHQNILNITYKLDTGTFLLASMSALFYTFKITKPTPANNA